MEIIGSLKTKNMRKIFYFISGLFVVVAMIFIMKSDCDSRVILVFSDIFLGGLFVALSGKEIKKRSWAFHSLILSLFGVIVGAIFCVIVILVIKIFQLSITVIPTDLFVLLPAGSAFLSSLFIKPDLFDYTYDEFIKLETIKIKALRTEAREEREKFTSDYFKKNPDKDWLIISSRNNKVYRAGALGSTPTEYTQKEIMKALGHPVLLCVRPF